MNSINGFWEVRVKKPAQKSIKRAPRHEREQLRAICNTMGDNPFFGDIKRLKNERAAFRRRVGNWRIFFDIHEERKLIEIVYIERRTTTTYRKRHA